MPITDRPVLVTGATGFVAAELVKQLLEAGYTVRGTTRDVAKAKEQGELTSVPGAERLELVEADLNDPGAFTKYMSDTEYVIHTASPYILEVDDPQRDLVDPAVNGTLSVLKSAAESPTVKRVVLTSSFVAISSGAKAEPYTEDHWNATSTLDRGPYAFSKTVAEKAAWEFMEDTRPTFDLVAINPTGVIGPSIVRRLNQSHEFIAGMTNGTFPAIIDIQFPIVDVRDVALAHIRGMERPDAQGRYLVSAASPSVRQFIDEMKAAGLGDKYKLPSRGLDNAFGSRLVRLMLFTQPKGVRQFLGDSLGARYTLDTSKAETELGMQWRDIHQTIREAALDLDQWGHLGKR